VAAAVTNKRAAEKTNNKVNKIVSADSLDATMSPVLANAIYFKGSWPSVTKFYATLTKDELPHLTRRISLGKNHERGGRISLRSN